MQLFRNNAYSALAAGLTSGATTLTVTTGHGDRFPAVGAPDFCMLTLQDSANNIEVVRVTARAAGSDSMTIVRAQEGTTARSWSIGDIVELRLTAFGLNPLGLFEGGATSAALRTTLDVPTRTGGDASGTWGINITGNAVTATALQTSRIVTVGLTGKAFDGSGNIGFSLAEIGAVPAAGGIITGNLGVNGNLNVGGRISGDGSVPPGAVMHFAMSTAPTGWLKANGALVSRTTYAALFAAIGTTFGAGDGSTTFALPDLRGEFLRGWDDARGVDSGRAFGSAQASQNLSHTHSGTTGAQSNNHTHSGATDSQGSHQHVQGEGVSFYGGRYSTSDTGINISRFGINAYEGVSTLGNWTSFAGAHAHNLSTGGVSADHSHDFATSSDGGTEARPRNVALLACIKF